MLSPCLHLVCCPHRTATRRTVAHACVQTLTQLAILPNHSDYLASRLRALMREAGIGAWAMRKFFKTWVDVVRACTSEHRTLYPSAVEAELRGMGLAVPPTTSQQGFPTETTLAPEELQQKRAAEATIRKCAPRFLSYTLSSRGRLGACMSPG